MNLRKDFISFTLLGNRSSHIQNHTISTNILIYKDISSALKIISVKISYTCVYFLEINYLGRGEYISGASPVCG